ncbi:DUF2798 domain-containing protein [Amphritea sp.]|uniref:DUF2798 domain-containing protein n=1 Tax=Amphritea sp. TaxID=1872502 RepID=UPI003D0BF2D3
MKHRILFSIIMSFFLSSLMTLWITYINLGMSNTFVYSWLHAFILAWPAAGTISFFAAPVSQKITARIIR